MGNAAGQAWSSGVDTFWQAGPKALVSFWVRLVEKASGDDKSAAGSLWLTEGTVGEGDWLRPSMRSFAEADVDRPVLASGDLGG